MKKNMFRKFLPRASGRKFVIFWFCLIFLSIVLNNGGLSYAGCNHGLVGYWRLDETAANSCSGGEDSCDSSGNGNHLTWTNSPVIQADVPTVDFDPAKSLEFNDGTDEDDFASVGTTADLEGFSALTLSAWVNPQGAAPDHWSRFMSKSNGTTGDDYALSYADTNGSCSNAPTDNNELFAFRTTTSTSGTKTLCSDQTYTQGTGWYHIAGTWDGSTMRLYVDGVKESDTAAATGTLQDSNDSFSIGRHADSADQRFLDGYVSDARIYDRALSDEEIANLANGKACAGNRVIRVH